MEILPIELPALPSRWLPGYLQRLDERAVLLLKVGEELKERYAELSAIGTKVGGEELKRLGFDTDNPLSLIDLLSRPDVMTNVTAHVMEICGQAYSKLRGQHIAYTKKESEFLDAYMGLAELKPMWPLKDELSLGLLIALGHDGVVSTDLDFLKGDRCPGHDILDNAEDFPTPSLEQEIQEAYQTDAANVWTLRNPSKVVSTRALLAPAAVRLQKWYEERHPEKVDLIKQNMAMARNDRGPDVVVNINLVGMPASNSTFDYASR
jgi:hypothetical protein